MKQLAALCVLFLFSCGKPEGKEDKSPIAPMGQALSCKTTFPGIADQGQYEVEFSIATLASGSKHLDLVAKYVGSEGLNFIESAGSVAVDGKLEIETHGFKAVLTGEQATITRKTTGEAKPVTCQK